ncbi:thiol-disulfide oxidoreductase DCC family protein [Streptomyces sp. NPDC050085]|uniref:thiol-disulfide oxidoreductase DCC family protein n=1 Tax=Streptomyces sp. NPDC050085 TaxID=3365600 RepID=UPI0037B62D5E
MDRGARGDVPVRRLTVLYDAQCPLCTFVRGWLGRQRQLVPLEFVAAGSREARQRYPGIDHAATLGDITVIGDGGQLYRGGAAWVVCMWALREHRVTAHRMCTPAGMKVAKQIVLGVAKYRERQFGGGAYRRQDGWTYDRSIGWTYLPANDPAACDSGCRVGD